MDLVESKIFQGARHPWETARVDAVRAILRGRLALEQPLRALDLGCGDGYVAASLFGPLPQAAAALVDTGFTPEVSAGMDSFGGRFTYHRSLESLGQGSFGLILMLDVLEHAEDDLALLCDVVSRLADGGAALITVPAFQSLFSAHDRFLKHYRRYNLGQLSALAQKAGLAIESSGYLFSTLLLPRAISATAQNAGFASEEVKGVGGWGGGPLITGLVHRALCVDNSILTTLAGAGIRLPGLTTWALCVKQR